MTVSDGNRPRGPGRPKLVNDVELMMAVMGQYRSVVLVAAGRSAGAGPSFPARIPLDQAGSAPKPINFTCCPNLAKSSRLIVTTVSMPCTSMVATTFAS
jgi:hypothetical protein